MNTQPLKLPAQPLYTEINLTQQEASQTQQSQLNNVIRNLNELTDPSLGLLLDLSA